MSLESVNVLCLKWGTYYGPEYVNRLYAGVRKHLHRPFRFVCVTDDPTGLIDGIDAQPFPEPPPGWKLFWPNIFVKLLVFKDGFANLVGPTLFLDIDQIITGDLDPFFDYEPTKFCIIHNWVERRKRIFRKLPDIGNSSCFRFEAGTMNRVYEQFVREQNVAVDRKHFPTEQAYMTHAVGLANIAWWPNDFVKSFKRSCTRIFPLNLFLPPKPVKARILCFHGSPNMQQAIDGFTENYGKSVRIHLRCRPAKWVEALWKSANQ